MSAPDSAGPLRQRIRETARNRCGYCPSSQRYVMARLEPMDALRLNNELAVEVRRNWVLAGWHPPDE